MHVRRQQSFWRHWRRGDAHDPICSPVISNKKLNNDVFSGQTKNIETKTNKPVLLLVVRAAVVRSLALAA
jgi:hypothetical protein